MCLSFMCEFPVTLLFICKYENDVLAKYGCFVLLDIFNSRIVKGSIDKQVCSLGPDYIVSLIIIIGPILQMKKKKMRLSKVLLQG